MNGLPGGRNVTVRTLSLSPVVLEVDDFLSADECQHIIDISQPHMRTAAVVKMDHDKVGRCGRWWGSCGLCGTCGEAGMHACDAR